MNKKLFILSDNELKNMKPRLAKIDDVDQIQELLTIFAFIHKSAILNFIEKERCIVLGTSDNIIGCIITNAYFNTISDLVIYPEYRNKNIATQLFNYLINYHNINTLIIKATYTPFNSTGFWKRLGFKETGKIYIKKKETRLKEMVWFRYNEIEVE